MRRLVIAGAGRVGIGQRSQRPGFQMSQRADYVESDVGLQTTFNRPIVNTRDEPHADAARFRRLHIINGDANRFDAPIYLKVATTLFDLVSEVCLFNKIRAKKFNVMQIAKRLIVITFPLRYAKKPRMNPGRVCSISSHRDIISCSFKNMLSGFITVKRRRRTRW